jgi:flagellar motor switch protein FliG
MLNQGQTAPARPTPAASPRPLTRRQKAAVIVRLLLDQGAQVPLDRLPEEHQADLTRAMGELRAIDRATLRAVVEEFVAELEAVGLTFPGGLEGALAALEGHISAAAANRLRRQAGLAARIDPWPRIAAAAPARLAALLQSESAEVGAVLLSKLPVELAAELLGQLPGERARRLARAFADTGRIAPETVARIGHALLAELEADRPPAFASAPVDRVGAILNSSPAALRDEVLSGLDAEDAAFAAEVRRKIFTFADIATRVEPADVPRIVRETDPRALVTALAYAAEAGGAFAASAEHLLGNLSQRMAGQLRDQVADRGAVAAKEGEAALAAVVAAVRALEGRGELVLKPPPGL